MDARWAERAILEIVRTTLFDRKGVQEIARQGRADLAQSRKDGPRETGPQRQLAEADQEKERLVQPIRQGVPLDGLVDAARAVAERRERLEAELAAVGDGGSDALDFLPEVVREAKADLRAMLEAGQVEAVRRPSRAWLHAQM